MTRLGNVGRLAALLTIGVTLGTAGCSSTADDGAGAAFKCQLGQLTGTWRLHYTETNGTCGAIADETAVFPPTIAVGCVVRRSEVSDDRCSATDAFACPTADGLGTQEWVIVSHQVALDRLESTGTVEVNHAQLGYCRSTYAVDVARL